MKDFFSFHRFILLLKNHLIENRKKYVLFSVSIFAIGFFIVLLFFIFDGSTRYSCYCLNANGTKDYIEHNRDWLMIQNIIYWPGLFIFGGLFALTSYVNFGNQGEAIFYMNKPASIFEKWLVEVFVRMILFFVVYTALFYILFIPGTLLYNALERMTFHDYYASIKLDENHIRDFCAGGKQPIFQSSPLFDFNIFGEDDQVWLLYMVLVSSYISGIAFFMYGAVLFNKFSFFKTFLLGFGVFLVYVFYALIVNPRQNIFIASGWEHDLFRLRAYKIENSNLYVVMEESYLFTLYAILTVFVPIALLVVSYFKLKEKEI